MNLSQKVLVRKEAVTDAQYGMHPEQRSIAELIHNGIINLNKPQGPSSHQVSDYAKKILGVEKAGHGGTLDPHVSGVLPVALGNATKIVRALLPSGKEYIALMYLHKPVSEEGIRAAFSKFIGEIEQLPPLKSAVKRQWRKRNIYELEIIEIDSQHVLFRVSCQAGTYIRKLIVDIGKELGMGAHMVELVRIRAGPFTYKSWVSLHDLQDAYAFYKEGNEQELKRCIQPVEAALLNIKKVWVLDSAVDAICHGAQLSTPGIAKLGEGINHGDLLAVLTLKGELVALGEAVMNSQNMLLQEKGIAVKNKRVFMERGVYPRHKKTEKQG